MSNALKLLLLALLISSITGNVILWRRAESIRAEPSSSSAEERLAEIEALRRDNAVLKTNHDLSVSALETANRELARLRNEVTASRRTPKEPPPARFSPSSTDKSASGTLTAQFAAATQQLARLSLDYERQWKQADAMDVELVNASPERLLELQRIAQSNQCINHLKHIALAARIWANDHGNVFPPDFLSMKGELEAQHLFCPGVPGPRATDWTQVNVGSISYRLVNPNGTEFDPNKPLIVCPFHGNLAMSDGSARKPPQQTAAP